MRGGRRERRITFCPLPSTRSTGKQLALCVTSAGSGPLRSSRRAVADWPGRAGPSQIGRLRPNLRHPPGGAIYVIGGAALASSLMNDGLIDELRLIVHPIILGGGKAPFAGVRDRRTLELVQSPLALATDQIERGRTSARCQSIGPVRPSEAKWLSSDRVGFSARTSEYP